MNQNCYQEEVEIDLIQFCKRLLVQWRAVVAVALIFGLLVMAGKYVKDDRAYRASAEASEAAEATIEDVEASLTAEEIDAVKLAVATQQQIDAKEAYLKDSILMNMDASKCKAVTVQYLIKTDATVDAADVSYLYQSCVKSDESLNSFGKEIGLDADASYIRELFNDNLTTYVKDDSQTAFLELTVYTPEDVDEENVATALKHAIENCDDVNSAFHYTLTFVRSTIDAPSVSVVQTMQSNQLNAKSDLSSWKTNQKTTVDAFSDAQKQLYQMNISDTEDEEASDDANEADEMLSTPASLSAKFFVVGAFLGIVLYAGLFFVYIILNSRAVELDVAGVTTMPCLGLVKADQTQNNGFLSFFTCDQLIYNLLYKEQVDRLSKSENIIGQMKVYAGGDKSDRFCVLQPDLETEDSSAMQALKEKASSLGVDIEVVAIDVSDVSDTVSKLDATVPTVVSIYESKTKKKDVYALYEILKNQKVKVLGELYVR